MKRAIQTTMDFGADGTRSVVVRLGGADIARAEWYKLEFSSNFKGANRLWIAEAKQHKELLELKVGLTKKEEIEKPKRETGGGPRRDPKGKRGKKPQGK